MGSPGAWMGGGCTRTTAQVPAHARSPPWSVNSTHALAAGHGEQPVRGLREPAGLRCPSEPSSQVVQHGLDATALARQRSACQEGEPPKRALLYRAFIMPV